MDILLNKWTPALLAGLISFATAWFFKSLERNKYYKDKRIERADQTISHFAVYIEYWRKLMLIAELAADRELTENEAKRLERYVAERDEAKQELTACLATLSLYFGSDVINVSKQFSDWDKEQASKRLDELPDISEWEDRLQRLSLSLKRHV